MFSPFLLQSPASTSRRRRAHSALRAGSLAVAASLLLAACGGEKDSGTVDLSKGLGGLFGGSRMKTLAAGTAAQGGVLINEVHAANWKGDRDEDGDAEDWLELYNPAAAEVDLSGYGLSGNTASPFRWAFPAGQKIGAGAYLRVWLSKKNRATVGQSLHASFNLDNGADSVFLSASNATAVGILVDSTKPALVKPDQSWCRMPSGQAAAAFQICMTPTPGAANSGPAFASMLAKPVFSVASGLYAGAQMVSLSGPAGATIRFTTDGSMPTEASPAYTEPLTVASSQVVRAASFSASAVSSPAQSHSYVIDAALAARYASLKTLFVVMEPADFTRYQARDKDLNAQMNLELLSAGTQLFKQDADGSVAGNAGSLDSPQIALNANAKDVFGAKDFVSTAPLWAAKPGITKTKKLRVRNGGNDWAAARLRDQLSQDLAAAGPNITGAATSVAMFVNGQYYALMDLREREDETIVTNNTGADKDYVDYLENPLIPGQEIKNGGGAALGAYQTAHNFITGNDMSVAANYAQAKTLVDVNSLSWDWGHHQLLANYDWPNNNVHVFRSPELGKLWTWRPHDFDFAMGRYVGPERDMNSSYTAVGSPMFAALLRNTEFKNLYLNHAADQMNLMTPTFMNARLDLMTADMRPYVNDTFTRNGLGGEAAWNTQVASLRNWIKLREPFHDQQLRTQFGLGNRGAIGVAINDRAMGTVKVNSLDVGAQMGGTGGASTTSNAWTGKFYPGIPLSLEAKPKPGFVFVGWQGASTATTRNISHTVPATTAVPADGFAVRWSGQLVAPATGAYRFQTIADDGVALNIDGQLLINNAVSRAETTTTTTAINLTAGQRYNIVAQYFDLSGSATMRLLWLPPGASEYVPVPAAQLYPDAAAPYATGLFGAYFNNTGFTGEPVASAIENIDFAWGTQAPTPSAAEYQAVFAPGPEPAAPSFTAVGPQIASTGDLVNLPLAATDSNGHSLRFSATGLPKGVSINATTGIIFGRITTPGNYSGVVTATNGASSATLTISWTVSDRPGTGTLGTSADSGSPAANTPPTVALTSPTAGQTIANGVATTLTANAADGDGSVASVEFYDGANLIGSDTTVPFSISWSSNVAGSHTLTARATDNQGAITTSASVNVTVQAAVNTPPVVALTAPTAGEAIANGAAVTVSASAADTDGSVARVDFYDGSTLIGTDSTAPFSISWSSTAAGSHQLSARATDNLGAATSSAAVAVTVQAPAANIPPTVALVTPTGGQVLANGATLTLSANASDTDGSLARVEFYDGGTLLGSDTSAPYSISVTMTAAGVHSFTARAVDNLGAASTSAAVAVTVSPAPDAAVPGVLKAEYWANRTLTGTPALTRLELPAMNLTAGQASAASLPSSGFSVRWSGTLTPTTTGRYRLATRASSGDGVRLWVNGSLLIDTWNSPQTSSNNSIDLVANQGVPIRIEFFDAAAEAQFGLSWMLPGTSTYVSISSSRFNSASVASTVRGLRGDYFNGTALGTVPQFTRVEAIDFNWGSGAPSTAVPQNNFSARWTGYITAPATGNYQFQTVANDGVRVWVNDRQIISNWTTRLFLSATNTSGTVALTAGQRVPVRVEYFDQSGNAEVRLRWRVPGSSSYVAVPAAVMTPP